MAASGATHVKVDERTALIPGQRASASTRQNRVLHSIASALVCTALVLGVAMLTLPSQEWVRKVGWFVWPEYSTDNCDLNEGDIYTRLGMVKHFENNPNVVIVNQKTLLEHKVPMKKDGVLLIVDNPTSASDLSVRGHLVKVMLDAGFKGVWADDILDEKAVLPPGLHALPLGVRSSTYCQYKHDLLNAIDTMVPFKEKSIVALSNFHLKGADFLEKTEMPSGLKFNPRKEAIDILQNNAGEAVHWQDHMQEIAETYYDKKNYAFEISPFGNGIDCYRTWEALLLQTVPIVKSQGHKNDLLYEGMPIVVVQDWHEVTKANLMKWHHKLVDTDWAAVRRKFALSRYVKEVNEVLNGH